MYTAEALKEYGQNLISVMSRNEPWERRDVILLVGGSVIFYYGLSLCSRSAQKSVLVKEPVEDLIRRGNMEFDLHKAISGIPDICGLKCRVFAWLAGSMLGQPLVKYMSAISLKPLYGIDIPEHATLLPFESAVPEYLQHTLTIKLFDVQSQVNFLKSNRSYSAEEGGFYFKSILNYHERFTAETTTPTALTHELKRMVEKSEIETPELRCFTQLAWVQAFIDAEASTARYKAGEPLSVIDGVPFAVKEVFAMAGLGRNCGRAMKEAPQKDDCEIVSVLRKAGAVCVGLTNMHEMGMGVTGLNVSNGSTRNPYNHHYFPGGSSSGSAAAVASGLLAFTIGTDGGGSVRIPSAMCGLAGMKPTFARYSPIGAAHIDSSVTSGGAIAGCVEDVALIHSILGKYAPSPIFFNRAVPEQSKTEREWDQHLTNGEIGDASQNPVSSKARRDTSDNVPGPIAPVPAPCFSTQPFEYITFGVPSQQIQHVHADIRAVFDTVLPKLAKKVDIVIGEGFHNKVAHFVTILGEMANNQEVYRDQRAQLAPCSQFVFSSCKDMSLWQYTQAAKQKTRAIKIMRDIFTKVDIIISPTVATTQRKVSKASLAHDEISDGYTMQIMWFVYMANLCGLPAISINMGYTKEGLPIGLMLMGSWWTEDKLLAAAHKLQTKLNKPLRYYCPLDTVQ